LLLIYHDFMRKAVLTFLLFSFIGPMNHPALIVALLRPFRAL
jgi:hypothetical protein